MCHMLITAVIYILLCNHALSQQGSYSNMAQNILDANNRTSDENSLDLDVFKFSVNELRSSIGDIVKNANGDPAIFGRTD